MQRRGYSHVSSNNHFNTDIVTGLLNTAITREGLQDSQKSFIKRKRNDDTQIVKVVNNRLRSTVVITYAVSKLNKNRVINVFFKRYRKNTVEQFGQPCRETLEKNYDLNKMQDTIDFVKDVEEHMRVTPSNLKTVNEKLPVRMKGFKTINKDTLYGLEIYAYKVKKNPNDVLNSIIELSLISDNYETTFDVKVADIINYNDITNLVGMYIVMNHKGSYKIKTKQDILTSYEVVGDFK